MMRRPRPQPIRNQLDLADSRQVRSVKKRLRLSEDQLNEIVGRIGLIAAISKEVALANAKRLRPANVVPEAAVIVAAVAAEPSIVESKETGRQYLLLRPKRSSF
jgi:hypothetical protein